ncbi:MAG TPA: alanine racemase [Syntrophorhabdaceae bacterium]|nr:alanine racemase [Syntrophorhabdaceae bacterium]HOL06037.1 alanine racemase [Syntrophorhabdaceae bacterium]HON85139.1 alanine racemase [Syntrophorhabdaceae bacterium]HOT41259.1 alanine racemase [Syntrophorhabdaceae bacterium]HPC66070.1 alanine racemase [Syntrophorhabdaceae bacterium]
MKINDSIPRATVSIDLGSIEDNYRAIKSILSHDVKILCVVKADAYGHGAVEVTRRLEFIGAGYFGVATLKEAIELRKNSIKSPILVMSGILPWDNTRPFIQHNLAPVIYDMEALKRIADEGMGFDSSINIHVKFDTGMGRLGFNQDDVPYVIEIIKRAKNIHVEGIMSHFSSSEVRDDYGLGQVGRFRDILNTMRAHGIDPQYVHMANTGAILNYPEAHFNMVRLGIGLYGSYPDLSLMDKIRLKQVMRLSSRIALIRTFPRGCSLSYGGTFKTGEDKTKIAYIPLGYSDGYPRALSNRGFVLIKDMRCCIVGRVCMDWILVDITGHDDFKVGDEVIFMGSGRDGSITADEIAHLEGTIPYEVLCRVSRKIQRTYVG